MRSVFSSYNLKLINIALQFLHKHADMVPVTDSVMHLDCQRQQPFSIPLKELTHGKNRQQKLAFVKDIDIESCKLHPGHHGDVEGVGWCSILGGVAGRSAVFPGIDFVVFQKLVVIFREVRPDTWYSRSKLNMNVASVKSLPLNAFFSFDFP